MGLLKVVTLDEVCNRPLFRLLDAIDVLPVNTHNKPSVATAFNTKAMCAKEVIEPGEATGFLLPSSPLFYCLKAIFMFS